MNTIEQKENYIREIREAATKILDGQEELNSLFTHWNAEALGSLLQDTDFVGDNEGLTVLNLSDVIGTTRSAIETLFAAGHYTNLYRLKIGLGYVSE